ncbi:hypothetical protein ACIBQ1_60950 [Nonomuraea sp. NPDC050153]
MDVFDERAFARSRAAAMFGDHLAAGLPMGLSNPPSDAVDTLSDHAS